MPYYVNILAKIYNTLSQKFLKCASSLIENVQADFRRDRIYLKGGSLQPRLPTSHFLGQLTFVCSTFQISPESFFEERMPRIFFLKVLENNQANTPHFYLAMYILRREKWPFEVGKGCFDYQGSILCHYFQPSTPAFHSFLKSAGEESMGNLQQESPLTNTIPFISKQFGLELLLSLKYSYGLGLTQQHFYLWSVMKFLRHTSAQTFTLNFSK